MPAKWRPRIVMYPPARYSPAKEEFEIRICLCDQHKAEATLDTMVKGRARVAIDRICATKGKPQPDWHRTEIEWDQVDPRDHSSEVFRQ